MKTWFLIALAAAFGLAIGVRAAYGEEGGEHNNTHCNGVGNPNSYCDGTEVIPDPDPEQPAVELVCLVPTEAAAAFLDKPFAFASDTKACERQCRVLAGACSAIVEGNAKCYDGLAKGIRAFALATCATYEDVEDRKFCAAVVRSQSQIGSGGLRDNTAAATRTCIASFDACAAACQE